MSWIFRIYYYFTYLGILHSRSDISITCIRSTSFCQSIQHQSMPSIDFISHTNFTTRIYKIQYFALAIRRSADYCSTTILHFTFTPERCSRETKCRRNIEFRQRQISLNKSSGFYYIHIIIISKTITLVNFPIRITQIILNYHIIIRKISLGKLVYINPLFTTQQIIHRFIMFTYRVININTCQHIYPLIKTIAICRIKSSFYQIIMPLLQNVFCTSVRISNIIEIVSMIQ